jgi:hypothetical protein
VRLIFAGNYFGACFLDFTIFLATFFALTAGAAAFFDCLPISIFFRFFLLIVLI